MGRGVSLFSSFCLGGLQVHSTPAQAIIQFIPLLALWLIQGENMTTVANVQGFPSGSVVKNPAASAGDKGVSGLISELGRSPGGGNGKPLQYSCLEIPMDRGAWWATGHVVAEWDTI